VGGTGIYSVFFSVFFIVLGACYGTVRYQSFVPARDALVIVSGLAICTLAATLPTVIYARENGPNTAVVDRRPSEAEVYGLRVTQLLIPIADHRIPRLAQLRRNYDAEGTAVPVNENGGASLGIVGSAGFMLLLVYLIGWQDRNQRTELLSVLSALNVWAVLLATIGGFSTVIAIVVTPKIRGYNRISPYIAFFALATVSFAISALLRKGGVTRLLTYAAMPAILIGGILDQTSNMNVPDYGTLSRVVAQDRHFIRQIEHELPRGAMVFQLPYVPWPEYPPVYSLPDYELLRGYLHSESLRWSYGAMKGRPGDVWLRHVSSQPVSEMIDSLVIAGFSGIYLDRRGYPDQNVEQSIIEAVGQPAVIAADNTRVFFSLSNYTRALRNAYSNGDWSRMRTETLHPVIATWAQGCSSLEGTPDVSSWRWCGANSILALHNSDTAARQVSFNADVSTGLSQTSTLTIEAGETSRSIQLSGQTRTSVSLPLTLRPGTTLVRFHSDAQPLITPSDPRKLVLRFADINISDGTPPATFKWESGCWGQEVAVSRQWRWCTDSAMLRIDNHASGAKQVAIDLSFQLGGKKSAEFRVTAPGYSDKFVANPGVSSIRRVLSIPAGMSHIQLKTNAKPLHAPSDPRKLVFRVFRFHVIDLTRIPVLNGN
jgi:hypothetical protein